LIKTTNVHGKTGEVTLTAALVPNLLTHAIIDGSVAPEGLRLRATGMHPSEIYFRQLKSAEFDVSDLSLSSLIIATSHEPTPWVAIPVFTTRIFFHTRILVRTDAGIATPADLRGKRVAVPEYQQTGALWNRGILKEQFGVDPSEIEWYMERPPEKSHGGTMGFEPPPGVRLQYIPPETNIGEMIVAGKIDATLSYLNAANLVDRSRIDLSGRSDVRLLFPDPAAEAHRYYAATGVYPINHTLVVRRSLLEEHPWIAQSLYQAFATVKAQRTKDREELLAPYFAVGGLGADTAVALRQDPLAYGIKAARPVLETIARYTFEQGLAKRLVSLDEIFAPSTMDL
jgi:4,5-dihydroxyphthalate decarboxylase